MQAFGGGFAVFGAVAVTYVPPLGVVAMLVGLALFVVGRINS